MDITITLPYNDIISRATMLSAFEAKEAVAPDGSKNFSDVRITAKEHTALQNYIQEGASIIEARLAKNFHITSSITTTINNGITTDTGLQWVLHDETTRRDNGNSDGTLIRSVKEALVCFTLARWFENKLEKTAKTYSGMFADLSDSACRIIITKRKPSRPQS